MGSFMGMAASALGEMGASTAAADSGAGGGPGGDMGGGGLDGLMSGGGGGGGGGQMPSGFGSGKGGRMVAQTSVPQADMTSLMNQQTIAQSQRPNMQNGEGSVMIGGEQASSPGHAKYLQEQVDKGKLKDDPPPVDEELFPILAENHKDMSQYAGMGGLMSPVQQQRQRQQNTPKVGEYLQSLMR